MGKLNRKSALMLAASLLALIGVPASAASFNIPSGTLAAALDAYSAQSGVPVAIATRSLGDAQSKGVVGEMSADQALTKILFGTGFSVRHVGSSIAIVRAQSSENSSYPVENIQIAQATPPRSAVETVTVTSSKLGGADVQSIPISITALSQEQLTSSQTAGGPDLVKQVPNLTFSKTNFTGYNIEIRGIGTQAISVTTDPAVAVALNDIPFIRNHFFEQEFYDLSQAEVLRGPQGTLYGRNATAGVVNLVTAKPTDQFEAMASADIGNYKNRRFEGMINIPIVDDRFDLRIAGEWTKRNGYSFNELTDSPIDGRDLWSGRVSLSWKPLQNLQSTFVWEHFQEDDDRMRTAKQLCKTAPIPTDVGGQNPLNFGGAGYYTSPADYLSQGCEMTSLYSPDAFQVPNGYTLAFYTPLSAAGAPTHVYFDVYASTVQSRDLRTIEAAINPVYKAKNDTFELNSEYRVTPTLTLTSQTGYNSDLLWSTEDYNRFNSAPGAFNGNSRVPSVTLPDPNNQGICVGGFGVCASLPLGAACNVDGSGTGGCDPDTIFCDPQLGCSDRLVLQDLSDERSWQISQEFRLASNFSGPLNFSVGGNFLHYETEENYYVFVNSLTLFAATTSYGSFLYGSNPPAWVPGISDNQYCLNGGLKTTNINVTQGALVSCAYIDPNPITSLNNEGHNYFLSQNPYTLNSYAGFGEVYYNILPDLKFTGGLRWTEDQKHFVDIPSELINPGYGYPSTGSVNQQWDQMTGRAVLNWTPKLDFTDQTLVYGSYSHGYKAGGANPPGAIFPLAGTGGVQTVADSRPTHPLTFRPEFINAFELGTKNTMLDGALTFNADAFYYSYKDYQISEIVDRTAINQNFNASVRGAEVEASWEPAPGLKFNFAGGYENATLNNGDRAIDLMDRTAGNPNWIVVKPFITVASNCILPTYVVAAGLVNGFFGYATCGNAYTGHVDPVTGLKYVASPTVTASSSVGVPVGYPGFDPLSVDPSAPANVNNGLGLPPNDGEGFYKNLGGNDLPNAPHFTTSLSAEYTVPVSPNWAATLHSDFYWQAKSWARVFNDNPYDEIRGYTNVNFALILTNTDGWQVMGYLKNAFNTTAITGTFLNSDDTGLTTNVFLTDPRLFGVRVTKNW